VLQVPTEYTVSYRIRRIDGTYRWVETTSRLVPDDSVIVAVTRSIDARISSLAALELERSCSGSPRTRDSWGRSSTR